jgi:putative endonuclease
MKVYNRKSGKMGEDIACEYLIKNGYRLIEKNFSTKFGEIDLIFSYKKILVFVEVKLKIGEEHGSPSEMINARKIYQIRKTAVTFLLKNSKFAILFPIQRIDAVCIVLNHDKSVKSINHYENIGI